MRARAGLAVLDRVVDGLLGDGVPPVLWGQERERDGAPIDLARARREVESVSLSARDAAAERERIRSALHAAHVRRARRRRLVRIG